MSFHLKSFCNRSKSSTGILLFEFKFIDLISNTRGTNWRLKICWYENRPYLIPRIEPISKVREVYKSTTLGYMAYKSFLKINFILSLKIAQCLFNLNLQFFNL